MKLPPKLDHPQDRWQGPGPGPGHRATAKTGAPTGPPGPGHRDRATRPGHTSPDQTKINLYPVWLFQKKLEKSKEVNWRALSQAEKEEYDEAQAVEVTNVVRERAVRALTAQEVATVDHSKAMAMRWVLTRKQSGAAKARLVVLGFQAPNLLEVETAAPTLSTTGRHVLLTAASNARMVVESGDVTSAFLQSIGSLESESLIVFAPSELATMFGADPADAGMLMKLTKAFYGLVHAPRKWHESVVAALYWLTDGHN